MNAAKLPEARLEPTKSAKVNLSITLEPALKRAIDEYAATQRATVSSVVALAMTEFLQREGK